MTLLIDRQVFVMKWSEDESGYIAEEELKKHSIAEYDNNPTACAKGLIESFNNTLKPGESKRTLIHVEVWNWNKVKLYRR